MADSGIKTVLTLGIIGGLAWWAYNTFLAAPATASTTGGGATPPANPALAQLQAYIASLTGKTPATPPLAVPPATPDTSNLVGALQKAWNAAKAAGAISDTSSTLSMDQWNYYVDTALNLPNFASSQGINPDDLLPGQADRGGPLTFAQYSLLAQQKGLSAYRARPLFRVMRGGRR